MTSNSGVFKHEPTGPLVLGEVEYRELKGSELRVRTEAVSVNPGDQKALDGKLYPPSYYPRILGGDHAGVVVRVRSEVKGFSKGDRVASFTLVRGMPGGSFQDYVIVPAKYAIRIPDHYSFAEAVTMPSSALTILAAFHEFGWNLPYENITTNGEPVLVWGGGSSLGQTAISLLKLSGYQNIITTSSSVHETGLQDRGATHVVDYRSSDVVAKLRLLLRGQPLMKAIDCVSTTETAHQVLPLMSSGSQLAWVLPSELPARSDVDAKFVYAGAFHNAEDANGPLEMTGKIFTILSKLLSTKDLTIQKQRIITSTASTRVDKIKEAIEIHRAKATNGEKIVVTWSL